MSVMVIEPKTLDAVYRKLVFYENNNQVDENYNEAVKSYLYNGGSLKQLIKDWFWLNEMSYIRRYREDLEGAIPDLEPFLTFVSTVSISPAQMLKTLQFLLYNIEIGTIKHGYDEKIQKPMQIPEGIMHSYETLIKIIDGCKDAIIRELDEYKKANWGEL